MKNIVQKTKPKMQEIIKITRECPRCGKVQTFNSQQCKLWKMDDGSYKLEARIVCNRHKTAYIADVEATTHHKHRQKGTPVTFYINQLGNMQLLGVECFEDVEVSRVDAH